MSPRARGYPLIVEHLGPNGQAVEPVLLSGAARGEIRNALALPELAQQFVGRPTLRHAVTLFLDGPARAHPHGGEADGR